MTGVRLPLIIIVSSILMLVVILAFNNGYQFGKDLALRDSTAEAAFRQD